MVHIEKKWIESEQVTFTESVNEKTGKKEFILETKIFPYDKKSRNGVQYNKESALKTKDNIVGITLNHNHVTSGENNFPRGEWFAAFDGGDGLYGKAKVYDTTYNKDYIEWLSNAENIRVSLQVSGDAESVKGKDGKYYREAKINDWLEISTVNLPGFVDAKANFEKVMCEMVKINEENNMQESIQEEAIKVGDKVHSPSGFAKVISIKGNKVIVRSNDPAGDFEYDIKDVRKESLRESHLNVGDQADLAGVKVEIIEVTEDGYVVKELEQVNDEPSEEPTESESFYTKLNKIKDKYI